MIGFAPDEISCVFELLSGMLNLGNIDFKGYSLPNGTDASKLKRVDESKDLVIPQVLHEFYGYRVHHLYL